MCKRDDSKALLLAIVITLSGASAETQEGTRDAPVSLESNQVHRFSLTLPQPLPYPVTINPIPKQPPGLFTKSCSETFLPTDKGSSQSVVSHAYSYNEFVEKKNEGEELIVIHGINRAVSRSDVVLYNEELLPIYVNSESPVKNLTTRDIRRILNGGIRNWNQLGGNDQPIDVFLHGGEFQRKSASIFFKSIGVKMDDENLLEITPQYVSVNGYDKSYQALAEQASEDPNALVIGLQEESPDWNLNRITVENKDIVRDPKSYPLRMPILVFEREEEN